MKYSQMFQSNDQSSSGYLGGQAAKTLLLQTGLAQATLVQVWNLSDHDKDGQLSLEEFIVAMHLCDFARAGNTLPTALPVELQPQRAKTASLPITSSPSPVFNSPPALANALVQQQSSAATALATAAGMSNELFFDLFFFIFCEVPNFSFGLSVCLSVRKKFFFYDFYIN